MSNQAAGNDMVLRRNEAPPDLADLLDAEREILRARIRAAQAGLSSHQGEMGASLEGAASAFLRSFLPHEYGVGRGFIVWRAFGEPRPRVSPQLDVIIYDALRGGPLADLGSSQIFPAECVYGYVEVKSHFFDELNKTLRVSHELRSSNVGCFIGRPGAVLEALNPSAHQRYLESLRNGVVPIPNATAVLPLRRPRIVTWVIAFRHDRPNRRGGLSPAGGIERRFLTAWNKVGGMAHLGGALIADVGGQKHKGGMVRDVFVRSVPHHPRKGTSPTNRAHLQLQDGIGAFKRHMMRDLALTDRRPIGLAIDYDGLWGDRSPIADIDEPSDWNDL